MSEEYEERFSTKNEWVLRERWEDDWRRREDTEKIDSMGYCVM
jgi:hypothetical protein